MSDIVERLRLLFPSDSTGASIEAADEIERLREWNREIAINAKAYADEAAALRAQNAELVAVLHRISLGSQNSMTSKEALGKEARAALAKTEKKTSE